MIARTRRTIAEMLAEIYGKIGWLASREVNLPATPEMKILVQRRLASATLSEITGTPVKHVSTRDGVKFYFPNDQWLLLRFSGTEPLLRIFAEAETDERADAFVAWARTMLLGR
jgi:phosphomannomutase